MRLERLEINGFKSFSDRSELAFDRGVTAIVGPNGCGKSNVADAITWVMGEQSAKSLRGDKMEDVIFSGSDARKPTAAAEVRLRFSGVLKTLSGPAFGEEAGPSDGSRAPANGHANGHVNGHSNGHANGHAARVIADHGVATEVVQSVAREVEVTRRLYRSGESEYLIDGQSCRLRDIHDLLMDTGLGAKAYAIIEQGKIGQVLSSRPTDRRQLIEEAAGVTKYKARRRAAELKLDAARQNLTRIDDIVFEVEKQRGTLKRQAAKARRYQRLRDEQRRWEKVLFARRYRQLAETIEMTRGRLAAAREREAAAVAHLSEHEASLGRVRIELVEAESRATSAREDAHARELAINRQQQQLAFEREQIDALAARTVSVTDEAVMLAARREPAAQLLAARRLAAGDAVSERELAAMRLATEAEAYEYAHREIEGFEADVEAARSDVYSAINSATALRHMLEHASSARDRVLETLSKLQIETDDLRIEGDRASAEQRDAAESRRRAQEALDATRIARAARESELASARIEHEWRARSVRSREHDLAGLRARLTSLEEIQAARAEYGDAARAVLAQANGKVDQQGAVADYLEVEAGFERAVEACLGDLLQHVVVADPDHAAAGLRLVRDQAAGRCGFLIAGATPLSVDGPAAPEKLEGLTPLSSVVRFVGPFADAIRAAVGDGFIAPTYEAAAATSTLTECAVATLQGDVFHGPALVTGGAPAERRGILETRREIRDLAARIEAEHQELARLAEETGGFEQAIVQASSAIAALGAEHHRQEKGLVVLDAQLQRASENAVRVAQKGEQLARERRQSEDERDVLERRQEEAGASIIQLERQQRIADERLTVAQRRLFEAREATDDLSHRAAEARASHAALVERATGLATEVVRLEEASIELEARAAALAAEIDEARARAESLRAAVRSGEAALDDHVRALDGLRAAVSAADETVSALRSRADDLESATRVARGALESHRSAVAELDVARATADADLSHLAGSCVATVQASLDEVAAEVAVLESAGGLVPDAGVIDADELDEAGGDAMVDRPAQSVAEAEQRALSAEEAIARLREKIDRLGPVNMMAIEQFDELEARHVFLAAQRHDLTESIAQTREAIARIDETTRQRFSEAFAAINRNFQEMFSTLFGGGRAGLTLLDENDPLESGIEIVAQPPGKRLQSVQLLSGGEKALTAISLMFGLFKYKPSPFCLLDEIDAPLDDANIGRFVGMLRSMQERTQFILITHNRKTMEIADRLYGVTMEEPGVSKLISVQLN
jgi:chromosome segregation protein